MLQWCRLAFWQQAGKAGLEESAKAGTISHAPKSMAKMIAKLRRIDRSIVARTIGCAFLVGLLSALICIAFRFSLVLMERIIIGQPGLLAEGAAHLPLWRRVATPVAGATIATLVTNWSRRYANSKGFVDYVEAVRSRVGQVSFAPTVWKVIASGFSLATGAAVGREGSMIQLAASSISLFGRKWKIQSISPERLVACGVAAAVATVYQAPVAGAFFALEIVLGIRVLSSEAIVEIPALLLSSMTGGLLSILVEGGKPLFKAATDPDLELRDVLSAAFTAAIIGLAGPLYLRITQGAREFKEFPLAVVWSGVLVGLLSCLQPEVWGNGDSGIHDIVGGKLTIAMAGSLLLLRLCATTTCVGAGVAGGVFTPTVFAGSVLGLLCGQVLHPSIPAHSLSLTYPILGMGCLLASVTRAPFMAAIIAAELTGTARLLPLTIVCCLLSWQIASKLSPQSIYDPATPEPATTAAKDEGEAQG